MAIITPRGEQVRGEGGVVQLSPSHSSPNPHSVGVCLYTRTHTTCRITTSTTPSQAQQATSSDIPSTNWQCTTSSCHRRRRDWWPCYGGGPPQGAKERACCYCFHPHIELKHTKHPTPTQTHKHQHQHQHTVQLGVPVVVLERAPSLRQEGSAISLWSNAWRGLDALGVSDQLRADTLLLDR